ncbi:reverse transcriptase/maturase family protein [Sphingobacterium wenxiniae]|uniref:Reverse transcriptase (RNA-dependent DNA polymerase) n=1 Tax=Sphingobacterium wenxiniae TaxID=683125 RepID=A0A1I6VPX6_9SPHI|nr:reverse transcriptase/maturase family protein [Sphingobacterium wenxiniae]SFT15785.1 Reverse transcriptase (RNA-dependent DNA polymerase) [Sphingobacterium wenxiniae]
MVLKRIYPRLFFNKKFFEKIFSSKILNSRSKGLDKMSARHFETIKVSQYEKVIEKCLNGTFEYTPYLELLKVKNAKTPPRTISIASVRDRLVLYVLKEVLTAKFPESVNKKRPNRYIHEIKKFVKESEIDVHFIKVDIERFYDTIDRDILYSILEDRGLNAIFMNLIKKAVENPTLPPNTKKKDRAHFIKNIGIPQGLPISNILAQIYLSTLDQEISKRQFLYLRYVDDILILNQGAISSFRKDNIKKSLTKLKLSLNEEKTSSGKLSDGVTFLSYYINHSTISISEKNIQSHLRKIAGKFTWYKNGEKNSSRREDWLQDDRRFKEVFLEDLNEIITGSRSGSKNYGWLFYFSEMTDLSLLFRIDKIIDTFFQALDSFGNKPPMQLKKLVRTYYSVKYGTNQNYINNYDDYNTVRKKRKYLIYRGAIDPDSNKSDVEINYLFERFKNKKLKNLEKDLGYQYIS